jgi:superfamily II DNA/RNA helicase
MQKTFRALGVSEPVTRLLAERGITTPFEIQERVLPDAIEGRDILARSPTGSGKTLAFALPITERIKPGDGPCTALVLVPTRELATQVAEEMTAVGRPAGLRVASVYGGVPLPAQAKRAAQAHVLVATPGRLEDLASRRLVSLKAVRILVLDEADRMLDMGFQPQVDRLVKRLRPDRQTMFFSATLDGEVGQLARAYTTDPCRVQADLPMEAREGDVEHHFVRVTQEDKVERLVEQLAIERGLALVFVRTKHGADRLVDRLSRHGVTAAALHGDLPQSRRERALAHFGSGRVSVLVATDVAARGLDVDDITHVVNYDPPEDDKAYVHRVGRTGRAGRTGTGITLVLPHEEADLSRVAVRLGHEARLQTSGMKVAPPRVVYSSKRRSGRWGNTGPRRKI